MGNTSGKGPQVTSTDRRERGTDLTWSSQIPLAAACENGKKYESFIT